MAPSTLRKRNSKSHRKSQRARDKKTGKFTKSVDRTNIVTCHLDIGVVEINMNDVEAIVHTYPLNKRHSPSGFPKEYKHLDRDIVFTARNSNRAAMFGNGGVATEERYYLEVPILITKNGVERFPVETYPRARCGRFRAIVCWPSKEIAGVVYHPVDKSEHETDTGFKKAHHDKSASPPQLSGPTE